jgi:hypothetical protein
VRPGREHDTTALRAHPEVLPLLAEWTDKVHAVLADLGYEGERAALTTPIKHPADRRLSADQRPRRRLRSDDRQRAAGPAVPLLPHRGRQPRRQPGGPDPRDLRQMLPCFRTAFDAPTAWVKDPCEESPPSATVPRPAGNGATDPEVLDSCRCTPRADPSCLPGRVSSIRRQRSRYSTCSLSPTDNELVQRRPPSGVALQTTPGPSTPPHVGARYSR